MVSIVGHGEDVGRHLLATASLVHLDNLIGVDGQASVRVDHHTEKSWVGLQKQRAKKTIKRVPGSLLAQMLCLLDFMVDVHCQSKILTGYFLIDLWSARQMIKEIFRSENAPRLNFNERERERYLWTSEFSNGENPVKLVNFFYVTVNPEYFVRTKLSYPWDPQPFVHMKFSYSH